MGQDMVVVLCVLIGWKREKERIRDTGRHDSINIRYHFSVQHIYIPNSYTISSLKFSNLFNPFVIVDIEERLFGHVKVLLS